jgi:hypothetical protein
MWDKIVQDAVKQSQTFEQITEHVFTEDPIMSKLSTFLREHKVYAKTAIENSLCGFVEYAKKAQTQQVS